MTTQNNWVRAANLVKTRITMTDNANNRFSGSKLLADLKNGQSLSKWDPELCIKMLQLPGVDNYLAIKKLIEKANRGWIVEFLERDGLGTLLSSLRAVGGKSLMDTMAQLQCVECLRSVVRSRTGLHYISTHLEYSSYLASAVMICNNTIVKLQVYELLCALCMFSPDGMIFVKAVLSHVKMDQRLRHDYEIAVLELKQADTFAYQTTLMAFVNCLILAEQNLRKRMCIRNELLALGLRSAIDSMAGYEDDALQIQISVFDEHQLADDNQEPPKSHHELLDKLRAKISNTLYDSYLHNLLLHMSEMDYADTKINEIWNLINEVICNDPQTQLDIYRKTSKTHSTGCQTTEKRLIKYLSPNTRRLSLDVSSKDKQTIVKTKRSSLPTLKAVSGLNENKKLNARPIRKPIQCSIYTQTDHVYCCDGCGNSTSNCVLELNNNRLGLSDGNCDQIPSRKHAEFCERSTIPQPLLPISHASSLPTLSEIPPCPPLPNPSKILPPPPLPTVSRIPPPPPLPTTSGIPVPPPLPTTSEIPFPPPPPPFLGMAPSPPPPPPPPPPPFLGVAPLSTSIAGTPPPPPPPPPFLGVAPSSTSIAGTPPPPPPLLGLTSSSTLPSLSPIKISELDQSNFGNLSISDGRRTVPTRRANNNIKYYSLPKTKMKTLNWTKVNNQYFDNSVWSSTDLPDLTINFRKIDELFCQKPRAKSAPAVLSTDVPKVNVVNVLDNKRSLAINITLKQFKSGPNEIIEALQNGTSIPLEKLKGLQRVLPTDDEIKMIKKQACNTQVTMGTAESFCLDLQGVSNYQLKIKLMIEKEEIPALVAEILDQLNGIKEMCHNLIGDQQFKQFLSLVLFIGNYMNAGSYAGNASGFTLDTLPKLLDTRANKPRVTFLHFVVEVAQTNSDKILSFTKHTSALRDLSRISFSSLEEEIKTITKQIRCLNTELSKHAKKPIFTQFSEFMKQAMIDMELLNEEFRTVTEVIGRVAVHFGEDVKKFKIEECYALLGNFFERIDVVAKENIDRRVQEEKNQMLASKLEKEKDNPSVKIRTRKSMVPKDEEVCIVDLVLQDIRRGSFNLKSVKSLQDEKYI